MTSAAQRRKAAKEFADFWKEQKGYEKGETQLFWNKLLRDVFDVAEPGDLIRYEEPIKVDKSGADGVQTNFIDALIPKTKVLVEQKSVDVDLRKPAKQSDGTFLTPYQQARKYADNLPNSDRPVWIVVCNFQEFLVYNLERPHDAPVSILLKDLPQKYDQLGFLVEFKDTKIVDETAISITAGEIVGRIYDAFLKEYQNPNSPATQRSLNILCVRLVFCLYAEDAGVFERNQFHNYLTDFAVDPRDALMKLFKVLDQEEEERSPYLDDRLRAFPYVNGGLFKDEDVEIPRIPLKLLTLILRDASEQFDWSGINPTIFGAVFESTLNPETRRQGGMHYTSVENIHKVIDPLFLDELREKFEKLRALTPPKRKDKRNEYFIRIAEFQKELGSLTFLDPACGSGNFLTETYLSLRRLENEALRLIYPKGTFFPSEDEGAVVKVSLDQFYGIEINDFAVSVAKTALWIAESQMLQETEGILDCQLDFLPLTNYNQIVEANALRIDWNDVVNKYRLDYIMGNPPFVGARLMSGAQKDDVYRTFGEGWKNVGDLDYVCCWYKRTVDFIEGTPIRAALVSTNSITQGESVGALWKPLFAEGVHIDFAHRTFRWDSETPSSKIAKVHCVIIGFSLSKNDRPKTLYDGRISHPCKNINAYLVDGPNVFVESRNKPYFDVPSIGIGNQPIDGGFYLFDKNEKETFIKKEPKSAAYFRPFYGAVEFINQKPRYCLWLGNCTPHELKEMPECLKRVQAVREFRLKSSRSSTLKLADRPTRFQVENMPDGNYLLVPRVSSERRYYIPIGFMNPDELTSDSVHILPNATLYHFGVLTSSVHMGWMRTVCGRLKSDYRYSAKIVYNNFPWPEASEEDEEKIAATAQGILDARKLYPDSSFADLYDETTMPIELRKAHQANDKAVMKAYGFNPEMSESEIVAKLMERYEELIGKN